MFSNGDRADKRFALFVDYLFIYLFETKLQSFLLFHAANLTITKLSEASSNFFESKTH